MLIRLGHFSGAVPKRDPRLLDQAMAQVAENCRLDSGALRAWASPLEVDYGPWRVGTKRSIYRWKDQWFHWLADVDVVRSPIATNINDRVIYTGDGKPRVTDDSIASGGSYLPALSYDLGIPAPSSTPAVSAGAAPPESTDEVKRARNYVFTYVSAWGEEGPPSEASATIEVVDQQPVTVSGLAPLSGSYAGPGHKRIYRANSGTQSTEYQMVAEVPMAQTSYQDTLAGADLAEALQTLNFDPPPADLAGLKVMPNGMLVGFSGNDLCFSEPYQPHAWPTDYRLHTDFPIVAVGVMGQSVLVATEGDTYIAQGVDPAGMSLRKEGASQACVAKRALVEVPGAVVYPGPDGLVLATETGLSLPTGQLLSRDDWQWYQPASMHAVFHDGRYFAFYDNGATKGCLILDMEGTGVTTSDVYADAAYADPISDALYLLLGDNLSAWGAGAGAMTYRWRSKVLDVPRPLNFSVAQVEADAYPLTLRVWADGVLRHAQAVASERPFRLPGGFLARSWELELEGSATAHALSIAESALELRGG